MSSSRRVMTGLDNVTMEFFIVTDIEFSLVIDESVLLFSFKEAVQELTRSFGFERLECFNHRRLAIQTVLDTLFK
jgi:hypothetical protein